MSLSARTCLGPYEILTPLAPAGWARCTAPAIRAWGAIKVSAERFSERFEREARLIASLNHP